MVAPNNKKTKTILATDAQTTVTSATERTEMAMATRVCNKTPPATRQCPPTHHINGKVTLTKDATGQSDREETKRQTGTTTHGGKTVKDVNGNQKDTKTNGNQTTNCTFPVNY